MKNKDLWYDIAKVINMNPLDIARKEIDRIDQEMASLYEQRLNAVVQVVQYKKEHQLPVFDGSREASILQKNQKYIKNPEYVSSYLSFMKDVMTNSRAFQQAILTQDVIAYVGIEGAFSHAVSNDLFPGAKKESYERFEDVFQAVVDKKVKYGILPLENNNSGFVPEVLDCLLKYPVYIQKVVDKKVEPCLLGVPNATLKDVKWVYSKDQALFQAKDFLNALNVQTVAYTNTAMAAQYVAAQHDKHKAAIGSKACADMYGLQVLASHIETNAQNTTRFLVIGLEEHLQGDRFSLCLTTKHTSGALARCIELIAQYGLNMECIQSRPIQGKEFEYFFFIELDGNVNATCMQALETVCEQVKFLGAYTMDRKDEQNEFHER